LLIEVKVFTQVNYFRICIYTSDSKSIKQNLIFRIFFKVFENHQLERKKDKATQAKMPLLL